MEYWRHNPRRRRKISFIIISLMETVSLSNSLSWNSGVDRLTQVLQGFSFPNFPQFEDQTQSSDVSVYYRPSDNSLIGTLTFRFGNSGSRTPPTQEQQDTILNALRSFGIKETTSPFVNTGGVWGSIAPSVTMSVRGDTISLEILKDISNIPLIKATDIISLYQSEKGEYYNRLLRRSPISFSAKPKFEMVTEINTFGLRITAPFNPQKTDIEMVKKYLNRSVSDIKEANMRRKADGEYKLGPVSGMVRGLRYGEEDEILDEDLMAEFDPNEIGERTDPRSYGHFTQQEYDEISDLFYNPRMASAEYFADSDGNYMSVQNIQEIQDMANFLAQQVHNGDTMEDWVEDKISSARQMLSDLTRYYSNGEKEMKGLDNWKYAKKQDSATDGAEGYFADIPYLRETREFAQSGEDTNVPSIDPKAQKNTPPTPSEIEQDDDVKTLGRVKVEEESVKQDKKASATARLLAQWKCLGEE